MCLLRIFYFFTLGKSIDKWTTFLSSDLYYNKTTTHHNNKLKSIPSLAVRTLGTGRVCGKWESVCFMQRRCLLVSISQQAPWGRWVQCHNRFDYFLRSPKFWFLNDISRFINIRNYLHFFKNPVWGPSATHLQNGFSMQFSHFAAFAVSWFQGQEPKAT